MKNLTSYRKGLLMVGLLAAISVGVVVFSPSTTQAAPDGKITLCHADGQAGTIKFSTITVAPTAANLHINLETGTPQAGHEDDYLGPCQSPSPSPTPTPTTTPGV
jgi:hypothetical protein